MWIPLRYLVNLLKFDHITETCEKLNPIDAKSVYEHSYKGAKNCPVHEVCHSEMISLLKLLKTLSHGYQIYSIEYYIKGILILGIMLPTTYQSINSNKN